MMHEQTNLAHLIGYPGCEPAFGELSEHAKAFLLGSDLPTGVKLRMLGAHALLLLSVMLRADADAVASMIAYLVDEEQLPEWLGEASLRDAMARHGMTQEELDAAMAVLAGRETS